MGYHLSVNITNHKNNSGDYLTVKDHDMEKGEWQDGVDPVTSIPDNDESTFAFACRHSGSVSTDNVKGWVLYNVPGYNDCCMEVRFMSRDSLNAEKGDYNLYSYSLYVILWDNNNPGFSSYYVINHNASAYSSSTDDFHIELELCPADPYGVPGIVPKSPSYSGTKFWLDNQTNQWLTLHEMDDEARLSKHNNQILNTYYIQ